jgi:GNAT superfamily N-acetyltransferase
VAGMDEVEIRAAAPADAGAIASVYMASFRATYTFPLAHPDAEVEAWVADILVLAEEVWVAAAPDRSIVAMMALTADTLDQLYVAPGWGGRGIGSRLLALAKDRRPAGLTLVTFLVNGNARQFYERRGFVEVGRGDGSGNEEGQPDVQYAWGPAT